jgi:hypothetical protein
MPSGVYRTNHPVTLFAKEGVGGRVAVSNSQMDMTQANSTRQLRVPQCGAIPSRETSLRNAFRTRLTMG